MTMLTKTRLRPLLQASSGPCVSLYMPTHRHHPDREQDPIRFKNLLKEAERLLSDRHSPLDIRALLDPVAALPSSEFWRHQMDGLAILRSPDVLEEFRLPFAVPELVAAADSFHLRPLIRALQSDLRYLVIALSQNEVTVYQGSADSLTPLEIPGLPRDLAGFMARPRGRRALSRHAVDVRAGVGQLHASGGHEVAAKDDLVPYLRAVDRAVGRALNREPVPVILAGVEYYMPIYRGLSRLKGLASGAIHGSPAVLAAKELHARARPVAEAVLRETEELALEQNRRAEERGRSTHRLEDIVVQARRGRVRQLFVAMGVLAWGTIDPASGKVHRTGVQQGSHDDDLFDDVAEAVFQHGGDVLTLPRDRMPHGHELVATLR